MATKKEKRERALEKRRLFMEEYRAEGLAALQKDREERAKAARLTDDKVKRRQAAQRLASNVQQPPATEADIAAMHMFLESLLIQGAHHILSSKE